LWSAVIPNAHRAATRAAPTNHEGRPRPTPAPLDKASGIRLFAARCLLLHHLYPELRMLTWRGRARPNEAKRCRRNGGPHLEFHPPAISDDHAGRAYCDAQSFSRHHQNCRGAPFGRPEGESQRAPGSHRGRPYKTTGCPCAGGNGRGVQVNHDG